VSNILFTNNTGGTFTVTGLTASGLSANYYASFSDNTNQVVSGANTPTVWRYNRTELSNGISLSGGTKIVVQYTGVYEIGYSAQIERTSSAGGDADVTIWASINDTPVERSSSTVTLVANSAYQLPFVSYIFELNAGDDVEFYFSSNSQYVRLAALSGLTSPTRPDAPSLIVVAKQIGTSVSVGSTGDTYVTGFTLNSNTVTLSQNRTDQYSAFTISLSAYTGSTTIQGITGITGTSGVSASTTDYGTTIINTAPDQTVIITGGTNIQITGTYPSFGVNFTGSTTGGTAIQSKLNLRQICYTNSLNNGICATKCRSSDQLHHIASSLSVGVSSEFRIGVTHIPKIPERSKFTAGNGGFIFKYKIVVVSTLNRIQHGNGGNRMLIHPIGGERRILATLIGYYLQLNGIRTNTRIDMIDRAHGSTSSGNGISITKRPS
jgi:hypothetical protein